ncbi:hypothetical protein TNCV_4895871 [Trichonephila clavipes]|nr:hypothetical protein TNCV_4895871 [Trichonephila clavipes]
MLARAPQDKWAYQRPSVFSEIFAQFRENSGSEVSLVPLEMEEAAPCVVNYQENLCVQVKHLTNSRQRRPI